MRLTQLLIFFFFFLRHWPGLCLGCVRVSQRGFMDNCAVWVTDGEAAELRWLLSSSLPSAGGGHHSFRQDRGGVTQVPKKAQSRGTERNKYVGNKREFPEEHRGEDCCSGMRRCLFCSIFECLSFEADLMKSMRKTAAICLCFY